MLEHLILSHHGELEKGSPKVPMTREAFVLHFADDVDAKMSTLARVLQDMKGGSETWTAYQPLFDRFFYRGSSAEASQGNIEESAPLGSEAGVQLSLWQRGGKSSGQ